MHLDNSGMYFISLIYCQTLCQQLIRKLINVGLVIEFTLTFFIRFSSFILNCQLYDVKTIFDN